MIDTKDPAIDRIANSEIVLQHFGYWPSFHDAVLDRVTFEVHSPSQASVTFVIAAFETINEIEEQGYHKQIKHCDIELQFVAIQKMILGFDHKPVIFNWTFEEYNGFIMCLILS